MSRVRGRPNVTFRTARASDRETYDWKPYYVDSNGPYPPQVVTVDGVLYLVMEGDTVVFQNGSEAIPDLVRMALRLHHALQSLYEDRDQRKREKNERDFHESMQRLHDLAGQA